MNYEEWLGQVPDNLKNDPVWKFMAYPKSLLLFDLVWEDCEKLKRKPQGKALINQLSSLPPSKTIVLAVSLDPECF